MSTGLEKSGNGAPHWIMNFSYSFFFVPFGTCPQMYWHHLYASAGHSFSSHHELLQHFHIKRWDEQIKWAKVAAHLLKFPKEQKWIISSSGHIFYIRQTQLQWRPMFANECIMSHKHSWSHVPVRSVWKLQSCRLNLFCFAAVTVSALKQLSVFSFPVNDNSEHHRFLPLVALLAELIINANSKCHQNETFGAWADRPREGERCEEVLVSLREQAEWN